MKIGILTFHRSINDGAVMQCYSLCQRLMHDFPDAKIEVVDYHMPKVQAHYDISVKKYLLSGGFTCLFKNAALLLLQPSLIRQKRSRNNAFEHCVSNLPLSREKIINNETEKLFTYINENYDIIIAGSDAIWNYNMRGFPNPYFLSDSIQIPKLSYAASCYGMMYEKISNERKKKIAKILDSYSFLGVRDEESAKFVKTMGCSARTVHTCDPTVFLNINEIPVNMEALKEKMKRRGFNFSKPAIGVMSGNKMCRMVRRMYGKKYQIVALQTPSIYADVNLHDLTPYEWSRVFTFFKLTITTFFHGTLVSLRNGVPAIAIALETEYSKEHVTKVQDFLRRINMEDCYFHTDFKKNGVQEIRKKADLLLNTNMEKAIIERMDKEARSAEAFIQQIERLKNNKELK